MLALSQNNLLVDCMTKQGHWIKEELLNKGFLSRVILINGGTKFEEALDVFRR
jgi:hypothetical protein